jgi:hypothetical protein
VNALAHDGSAIDPDIAMRHVIAIVNRGPGDTGESEVWLRTHWLVGVEAALEDYLKIVTPRGKFGG